MKVIDIVCCYVSDTVPVPNSMAILRKSFTDSGFREKELGKRKWLYKRGAPIALEFNYNSEAIEIQVILEELESDLRISVGNWGFPFEPLLMKNRFKRQLAAIAEQIKKQGKLEVNPQEVSDIETLSRKKSGAAKLVLVTVAVLTVVFAVAQNT